VTIGLFFRFWAAAGAIWLTALVVGGMSVTPLAAILLALVLALAGLLIDRVWPSTWAASGGLSAWMAGSVILFVAQYMVPGYRITALAAIVAGGLLWLLGQLVPGLFL
jgi:putative membrane protein